MTTQYLILYFTQTNTPIAENAKILNRAQRFGEVVSTKAKIIEENDRINRRKERFGFVASSTNGAKNNTVTKPTVVNSIVDEKIQKRQARFGVVEETGKNKNSSEPFSVSFLQKNMHLIHRYCIDKIIYLGKQATTICSVIRKQTT